MTMIIIPTKQILKVKMKMQRKSMKSIIQLTLIIYFLDWMIFIHFLKLEKYPITC